jgi:replicative DNA helicase
LTAWTNPWLTAGDPVSHADFFEPVHRLIFSGVRTLLEAGKPLDALTTCGAMDQHGELDAVGGLAFLVALHGSLSSATNVARYAATVRDRRARRELLAPSQRLAELAVAQRGESADERLEQAAGLVAAWGESRQATDEPPPFKHHLMAVIEDVERRVQEGGSTGLAYGFVALDRMTFGMQQGDVIVVA